MKKVFSRAGLLYSGRILTRQPSRFLLVFLGLLLIVGTSCGSVASPVSSRSPFHTTVQTSDQAFTVQVTITPDQLGTNTFTVMVLSHKQISPQQVTLHMTMLDMAMGTEGIPLNADGKGGFHGQGVLDMSGHWQISVVIQTPDHTLHEGHVHVALAYSLHSRRNLS